MDFDNPTRPELSVEVLSLDELRRRAPPGALARPLRPRFHQVFVLTRGRLVVEVDFERFVLRPGVAAWTVPGQVQRLDLGSDARGRLLLFTADVLEPTGPATPWVPPSPRIPLGSRAADVRWLVERIRRHAAPPHAADLTAGGHVRPLLRHLIHALLLLMRSGANDIERDGADVFAMLRDQVERRFATTRRLRDYERFVGYSSTEDDESNLAATGKNSCR